MATHTIETATPNAPPVVATIRSAGRTRLVYLDNLRMVVITAVVVMHTAIVYGAEGAWYYREAGEKDTLTYVIMALLGGIGSAFVMGLLFLVAGYFTPRAYDRKGAGRFLIDRFKRLGLPLVIYTVVILPIVKYLLDLHKGYQGPLGQWVIDYARGVSSLADGPVWFLMELLIFCVGYALWRLIADLAGKRTPPDRMGAAPPGNWTIAALAFGIGIATFIVRLWALVGAYVEPWHLEPAHAPQYIALFIAGVMAYRGDWLESFSAAQVRPWRWIALLFILLMPVLAVAAGAMTGQLDPQGAGGLNWLALVYSLWEGFICVALTIVVLDWFRRHFNQQGRLAKVMSDNCFAVYILHPIVIIPLALALGGIALNLSLKFVLVAPLAVTLCYLVAYLIRKIPFVRSVL